MQYYIDYFKNKPNYIKKRKTLRKNPTSAEQLFWYEIRANKLGIKFRRQFQIGKYIVDFYCHELKLIVELDGNIHESKQIQDKYRQNYLESLGYKVIRYCNEQVLFEMDGTIYYLIEQIKKIKSYGSPPRRGS